MTTPEQSLESTTGHIGCATLATALSSETSKSQRWRAAERYWLLSYNDHELRFSLWMPRMPSGSQLLLYRV
jgi:hypothetical protein